MNPTSIIRNKIFIYLATRYLTYGLQFVLSLVAAVRLGPYYLGVYGLVLLIISYFEQINFGIPHSLNVLLVHNKNDALRQEQYTLNSLAIFTAINVVSIITAFFLLAMGEIKWGDYKIDNFLLIIVFTTVCIYYNSVLTMVVRFRNRVNTLSIIGTIPVLFNFLVVFLFSEEALVYALLISTLVSYALTLIIFYYVNAFPKISIHSLSVACQKILINKGLYLFLYNSCFYFILIGVRTLISSNYSVEEFGYFTFSFTLANAVLLLLGSLNTIIFPKTLDMMSCNDVDQKKEALRKLRVGYITSANLLIFLAMTCFPLVTMLFPKYEAALTSMNLIALAVLMNTHSYGYTSLLIAQNKEKLTSFISLSALLLSLILGCLLVYIVNVEFSYVVLSVMGGYLLFSFLSYYYGNKELFGCASMKDTLCHFFPTRYSIPYIIALIISVWQFEVLIWIPLVVFLILNFKDFSYLVSLVKKLVNNPNVIDIK